MEKVVSKLCYITFSIFQAKPVGAAVVDVSRPSPRRIMGVDGKGTNKCRNLHLSKESAKMENNRTSCEGIQLRLHVEQPPAESCGANSFSELGVGGSEVYQKDCLVDSVNSVCQLSLSESSVVKDGKLYYCPICSRPFRNRSNMNKHKKLHNNTRPFVCDKCGNSYRQKHALKDHLKTHEEEGKLFSCKYCSMKFSGKQKWVTHENRHKGMCACICEVCGVRYENKYTLDDHMSKHTGEYKYSCIECKKGFNKIEALNDHSNVHSGDRPYTCDICRKRFANCGTFWQHRMTHKLERDFICEVCKKSFKLKAHLAKHLKIHSSERKHVCTECGLTFLKLYHLQRHKLLHTGEKPFICERCGQAFPRGDKLKEHQQKHHGISSIKLSRRPVMSTNAKVADK